MAHLQKLQEIADANGGTRIAGPPGYDASVRLRRRDVARQGFDVVTPEFTMGLFNADNESLSVNDEPVNAHASTSAETVPRRGQPADRCGRPWTTPGMHRIGL